MATYRATWNADYTIEFRDLTWKEYEDLCYGVDSDYIDPNLAMEVYKTCCLKGPALGLLTAGIMMFVARHQIINNPFSGEFKSIAGTLARGREYVTSNYLVAAQAVIANTFNYKIEEIKDFTAEKFFLRMAQAEIIVGQKINPQSPEEAHKQSSLPRLPVSPHDKIKQKVQQRDSKEVH